MGKLKTYSLKSSTIIETIIALTIILIIFGIATTLFANIMNSTDSIKKIKAKNILESYAYQTVEEKLFFDSNEQVDEFIINRSIIDVTNSNNILKIHFSISTDQKLLICEWDQLVIKGQ